MAEWQRPIQRVEVPAAETVDAWEWATGMPYRCLADGATGLVMPASPDAIAEEPRNAERRLRQKLAYFTALRSFLTYSFGWSRQDKGLMWWYDQGWPTDDPRLALVKKIWLDDRMLTGYLAWCITIPPKHAISALGAWVVRPDLAPLEAPLPWQDEFRAEVTGDLWWGGSDPLHIATPVHGCAGSLLPADGYGRVARAELVGVSLDRRSATFIADGENGWYGSLATLGDELPDLPGDRNWHIDVYVRPIGFLGTYRRSRETGLWFAGRHRFHIVGN